MNNEYIKHIVNLKELSGNHYRILLLLSVGKFNQVEISKILDIKKQNINKLFKDLLYLELIEEVERLGNNKYFKAITDIKKLNIPGQIKFI